MGKRVVFGLLGAALLLGMKFYNKSSDSKEIKAHLVSLCSGDSQCVQAVQTHFERCFESAYKLGGRRKASHLEADELVQCLNTRSGRRYFAASK